MQSMAGYLKQTDYTAFRDVITYCIAFLWPCTRYLDDEENDETIVLLIFSMSSLDKPNGCRRFVVGINKL